MHFWNRFIKCKIHHMTEARDLKIVYNVPYLCQFISIQSCLLVWTYECVCMWILLCFWMGLHETYCSKWFQCCSTVKNGNCEDVNFHVVTTSLYDVAKILPKRCYNVSHWVSRCFLIMEIILNFFSSSKRKLKT